MDQAQDADSVPQDAEPVETGEPEMQEAEPTNASEPGGMQPEPEDADVANEDDAPDVGQEEGQEEGLEAEAGAEDPADDTQADADAPSALEAAETTDLEAMTQAQLIQGIKVMRQEHSEQMNAEERARSELEDMLLRIEKHFKAEKAARQKAEELMQQAIENELSLKSQMDEDRQQFKDVDQALDGDREELRQERDALESMRIDFEQELHHARQEVAKSQDALKTAEDRVRSAEMIERQKLMADYEQRLQSLTSDMIRMRDEMQQRTMYMQREMQRYQAAALATAQSMAMAKKEVQERRREIDATRGKMDSLMDRLQIGNEHNAMLQTSIMTGQDHAGQLFTDNFSMGMMGMGGMDPAAMMSMMAPMGMATGKGGAFQPQKSQSAKTKQIGDYQGGLPAIGKDGKRTQSKSAKSAGELTKKRGY